MNRAQTITITTIDRWLLPHITSILAYADQEPTFALTLATWLDEENWSLTNTPEATASPYLMPQSRERAEDILDWLMYELATHPEARAARSMMMTWASNYQIPVTLFSDVAKEPTKKKRTQALNTPVAQLQIIIDTRIYDQCSLKELSEKTHNLSQQLIATELRKAGGKVGSLHPDSAEWSMAGAATKVYETDQADLLTLLHVAETEGVHHLIERDQEGPTMIAFSPSVADKLVEELLTPA